MDKHTTAVLKAAINRATSIAMTSTDPVIRAVAGAIVTDLQKLLKEVRDD